MHLAERKFKSPNISRRSFLKISGIAATALLGTAAGAKLAQVDRCIGDQEKSWTAATLPLESYFTDRENQEKLRGVRLGASFSPEIIEEMKKKNELGPEVNETTILRWAHDSLGIRDMRIGFRWNRCVKPNGEIDFSYYEKTFETCAMLKMDITLGLGIRVFRYPEDHIPQQIVEKHYPNGIPKGTVIDMHNPLAQEYLAFLDKLLDVLIDKYKHQPEKLERIIAFNPENEALSTLNGADELQIAPDYLLAVIKKINSKKELAGRKFILNSAGLNYKGLKAVKGPTFAHLTDFICDTVKSYPEFRGKFIAGLDYYYDTPWTKVTEKIYAFLFSRRLPDTITALKIIGGKDFIEEQLRKLQTDEIQAEVAIAESQHEPWETVTPTPGNSLQDFLANLHLQLATFSQRPFVISSWGLEYLYHASLHPSKDHLDIFQAFRYINGLDPLPTPIS